MHLYFDFLLLIQCASGVHIWGYLEGPWEWFFQIRSKKSFKTRPNGPYGGETSSYSLLQPGVLPTYYFILQKVFFKLGM